MKKLILFLLLLATMPAMAQGELKFGYLSYNVVMQAIQTKVLDAIKAVGQAGGYVYIMDIAGGIPYISTTLSTDVTADVKKKLGI